MKRLRHKLQWLGLDLTLWSVRQRMTDPAVAVAALVAWWHVPAPVEHVAQAWVVMAVAAGVAITGAAISAYSSYRQNQAQQEAAGDAVSMQREQMEIERKRQGQLAAQGQGLIGKAELRGRETLEEYNRRAQESLQQGADSARGSLARGHAGFERAVTEGRDQGLGYLREGAARANEVLEGRSDRLGSLLDRGFSDFEEDPGYEFRREQGEAALARQQALQGGRFSGRAMQAATDYNQGLASQEYGNFVNRRLSEMGFAGQFDARDLQARTSQAGVHTGSAANLANLAYGAGTNIGQQRYAAGAANANLATNLGVQQANLATSQGNNLAGLGMNAATSQANVLQGLAGTSLQMTNSQQAGYMLPVQFAGGGYGATGQLGGTMQQVGAMGMGYGAAGMGGGATPPPTPPPTPGPGSQAAPPTTYSI